MNFEQPQKLKTPEEVKVQEERENYEETVLERAKELKTIGERFPRKLAQEVIIADAKFEDTHHELLKEGSIDEEEFDFLGENNIKMRETGNFDIGYVKDIIEGMVQGDLVMVSRMEIFNDDERALGDDVDMMSSSDNTKYEVQINGQETNLEYNDRRNFFNKLVLIARKREAILEKAVS